MLVIMAISWPLGCFANKETRAIKRVGRHMQRIHGTSNTYMLRKIPANAAAEAMFAEAAAPRYMVRWSHHSESPYPPASRAPPSRILVMHRSHTGPITDI